MKILSRFAKNAGPNKVYKLKTTIWIEAIV